MIIAFLLILMADILIVDDENTIRRYLAESFKREGYRVDTVMSGTEALRQLTNILYDVVILDLKLPDLWGGEIVEYIHSHLPETKTFVFSTLTDSEVLQEDLKKKILYFFDKGSFNISEIKEAVKKVIERR